MEKTIYKVLDVCNGREYLCQSQLAVKKVISDLTCLPLNDPKVQEAADNGTSSFQISQEPLYTGR